MKPAIPEQFGSDYAEFCEVDPFNIHNEVSGVVCHKSTEFYGALYITKVNGVDCPQLIMATPKMHYPFFSRDDGTRNYQFPSAKEIEIYTKLDGTNILAYFYSDAKGNRFLSYKTRLRPFLSSGKFGNFLEMWREIATPFFPSIRQVMIDARCNLSFEMYGARNPHLIAYSNPLDIALLFGVTNQGNILSPNDLGQNCLPKASLLSVVSKDYVWNYEELQRKLQGELSQEEEGHYSGNEGAVWYLKTPDGRCIQYKCKPEMIEAIHFSAGAGGLSKNVILATCWNAFENEDSPSVGFIKTLLVEEFKPEIVEAHHYQIESCLEFVKKEQEFRSNVLEAYKSTGKSILLQKREVMKEIAPNFPREKMGKVYAVISSFA